MNFHRLRKPATALLLALVCAALVVTRAAAANGRSSAATASARVLAHRSLRGIETSIETPAGGHVATKGLAEEVASFLTFIGYTTENIIEHVAGGCNYGNWCGEKCVGKGGPPIDYMDERCKVHDECLATASDCERCMCHANLIRGIRKAVEKEDCLGDNFSSDRCQAIEAVKESQSIVLGMELKKVIDSCGNEPWEDNCPSSSSSPSSSTTYQYTITIATSCDSGAATDGDVRVQVTDSKGASFKTAALGDSIEDREHCSVDKHKLKPIETKVLLTSETTCEVYFEPKGSNPIWKPEYVKIARASDSETTKAAKFCNDGTLDAEGWYTFYHCD